MPRLPARPCRGAPRRFVAAAPALILLPALLAGCRSAPTSTPPPITHPSPHPSATSVPSTTPNPRPTRTALPTVDPAVPVPVAMSLDEARAEVWSWLDPEHAPRIVSADYIPGAAVATDRYMTRVPLAFDSFDDAAFGELLAGSRLPPTIVRVVAEYEPLEAPVGRAMGDFLYGDRAWAEVPTRLVALFDATSGARLAAMPVKARQIDVLDTTLAAPTVAVSIRGTLIPPTGTVDRPTATPLPTPTAVPTPTGPAVDAARVPPALRDVLTAYPLLPGSTWTWESTSLDEGVTWTRSTMTETVTGAWRLDESRIAVRTRFQWSQTFGSPPGGRASSGEADEWRTVTAAGAVYAYPSGSMATLGNRTIDLVEQGLKRLQLPLEARFNTLPDTPFWSWPDAVMTTRIAVTTPAGRFDGCGIFEVPGGQAMHAVRAICPGIGYVETDSSYGGNGGSGMMVTRLVSYHVVLPR